MSACSGIVKSSKPINDFKDDSKLWEFELDGTAGAHTCRVFNHLRHPVVGDSVLVFLMDGRNHAKEVVYDADLRVVKKALEGMQP
jgi:hypothetical protein